MQPRTNALPCAGGRSTRVRRRLVLLAAVFTALSAGSFPANATLITFDFTALPPEGAPPFTRTFTVGSLELTVAALGQDEDALPNPTETERVSYVPGKGLGVQDATDILVADIDAIDGNRGNEELVLSFNQPVLFKQLVFADFNDSDFAGEIFFVLSDGPFGDFSSPGANIAFFNATANGGAGNPNWQALPIYVFPGAKQGPMSTIKIFSQQPDSSILLSSLTVEAELVPEPGGWLLLLTGLGGLTLLRRKNAV